MIAAIRALLASRKFVLLLVGTIVAIGGRFGLALDTEIVGMIVGLFAIAIGGIAYEDGQAKSGVSKSLPIEGTIETTIDAHDPLPPGTTITTTTTIPAPKDPTP